MKTKLVCFYLPQYYETVENNEWWGQGYTDWTACQNAKRYFKTHNQPRVPLNDNYYDLSDERAIALKWQAELAKKYGIYGFCIYHYWFPHKRMLEKPVEILREHKEIDIHYSLCWDSKTWRRTWYTGQYEKEILLQQDYGDEKVWKQHFYDLLPDFMDERYMKINNKPVFHIYCIDEIRCLNEMMECWNKLAIENGFSGIYLIIGDVERRKEKSELKYVDAFYNYEPLHAFYESLKTWRGKKTIVKTGILKRINKYFHKTYLPDKRNAREIYNKIEENKEENLKKKVFLGIFSDYDDTPRRQIKGAVYVNNNIHLFEKCLKAQLDKSQKLKNEFLYITAWNEWGESAYLEPDSKNHYLYLETIKRIYDGKE